MLEGIVVGVKLFFALPKIPLVAHCVLELIQEVFVFAGDGEIVLGGVMVDAGFGIEIAVGPSSIG